MGYESKIYFVEKSNYNVQRTTTDDTKGKNYAQIIASIDLGKLEGGKPACFKKETDCYIYADDGNTRLVKDRYGEPLTEVSIEGLWSWLLTIPEPLYRRLYLLKVMTESFLTRYENWHNVVALHYGY